MIKPQYVLTQEDMDKINTFLEGIDKELGSLINNNNLSDDDKFRIFSISANINYLKNVLRTEDY